MSLFLKNLPKSFFRTVVSSRPIFNKATSLFTSIAINAQPKLPVCSAGRLHARTGFFGSGIEERKKSFCKKYHFYERNYSKKTGKPSFGKTKKSSKIVSGPVSCEVKDGEMVCVINCQGKEPEDKRKVEKKESSKKTEENLDVARKESCKKTIIEVPSSKVRIIPKSKSSEQPKKRRLSAKDLTGTWVSKSCVKFDFASLCKPKKDDSTKPIKLEDQNREQAWKIVSSKQAIHKSAAWPKSTSEENIGPCKKEKKEETKKKSAPCQTKKKKSIESKPCGAKAEERKPFEDKSVDSKPCEANSKERNSFEGKSADPKPCEAKSKKRKPSKAKSADRKPCEAKSKDRKSSEAKSAYLKPCEAKSKDRKLSEAKSADPKPCEAKSKDRKPSEAKSADPKPCEAKSKDRKPSEAKSTDPKPCEAKSKQRKPAEAKSRKPKPCELKSKERKSPGAKSTESKPCGAKSAEVKPCETESTEHKPAETKSAQSKPCKAKKEQKSPGELKPCGTETKSEEVKPCPLKTKSGEKQDQSPILQCVEKCKTSTSKKKSAKPQQKSKPKSEELCKVCSKKKEKKKVSVPVKKPYTPKRDKRVKKKVASPAKDQVDSSKLLVTVYDPATFEASTKNEVEARCQELIKQLKEELEECRRSQAKANKCVEPPKLDAELPKRKEQSKDVVSGSKNFLKSVREGIFTKEAKPKKTQSQPTVKTQTNVVRATKSADCKIDLNPKHCDKAKETKKEQKAKPTCEKKPKTSCKEEKPEKEEKEDLKCKAEELKKKRKALCSAAKPERSKSEEIKIVACKEESKKRVQSCPVKQTKCDKKVGDQKPCTEKNSNESKCSPKKKSKETESCSCNEASAPKVNKKCFISTDLEKIKIQAICARALEKLGKKLAPEPVCSSMEEPSDQSPIMQCIALCKKKKKADAPQIGKGIPPRDKKACSSDPQVYKKLVEFNEKQDKEEKEKNKEFVPCMYEEIKPGIRSVEIKMKEEEYKDGRVNCSCSELKKDQCDAKEKAADTIKNGEVMKNGKKVAELEKTNKKRDEKTENIRKISQSKKEKSTTKVASSPAIQTNKNRAKLSDKTSGHKNEPNDKKNKNLEKKYCNENPEKKNHFSSKTLPDFRLTGLQQKTKQLQETKERKEIKLSEVKNADRSKPSSGPNWKKPSVPSSTIQTNKNHAKLGDKTSGCKNEPNEKKTKNLEAASSKKKYCNEHLEKKNHFSSKTLPDFRLTGFQQKTEQLQETKGRKEINLSEVKNADRSKPSSVANWKKPSISSSTIQTNKNHAKLGDKTSGCKNEPNETKTKNLEAASSKKKYCNEHVEKKNHFSSKTLPDFRLTGLQQRTEQLQETKGRKEINLSEVKNADRSKPSSVPNWKKHWVPPIPKKSRIATLNGKYCQKFVKIPEITPQLDSKATVREKHTDSSDEINEKKEKDEIKIFVPCKYEKIKSSIRKPDDEENEKFEDCQEQLPCEDKDTEKEKIEEFVPARCEKIKPGISREGECENSQGEVDPKPFESSCSEEFKSETTKSEASKKLITPCPDLNDYPEELSKEENSVTSCKYEDIKAKIPYLNKTTKDCEAKPVDSCENKSSIDEKERHLLMSKASNTSLMVINYKSPKLASKMSSSCVKSPKLDTPLPEVPKQTKEITKGIVEFLRNFFNALSLRNKPSKSKSMDFVVKKSSKKDVKKTKSGGSLKECKAKKTAAEECEETCQEDKAASLKSKECKIDLNPKECDKPKKKASKEKVPQATKPCNKEETKTQVTKNLVTPCKEKEDQNVCDPQKEALHSKTSKPFVRPPPPCKHARLRSRSSICGTLVYPDKENTKDSECKGPKKVEVCPKIKAVCEPKTIDKKDENRCPTIKKDETPCPSKKTKECDLKPLISCGKPKQEPILAKLKHIITCGCGSECQHQDNKPKTCEEPKKKRKKSKSVTGPPKVTTGKKIRKTQRCGRKIDKIDKIPPKCQKRPTAGKCQNEVQEEKKKDLDTRCSDQDVHEEQDQSPIMQCIAYCRQKKKEQAEGVKTVSKLKKPGTNMRAKKLVEALEEKKEKPAVIYPCEDFNKTEEMTKSKEKKTDKQEKCKTKSRHDKKSKENLDKIVTKPTCKQEKEKLQVLKEESEKSKSKKGEKNIKEFAPCRYEERKTEIHKPEDEKCKEKQRKEDKECSDNYAQVQIDENKCKKFAFVCPNSEKRGKESEGKTKASKKDEKTKIFPCQYDEIKPEIRRSADKEDTKNLKDEKTCEDESKKDDKKEEKPSKDKELSCEHAQRKPQKEEKEEKIKVFVPCQYEKIKSALRRPENEGDEDQTQEKAPYKSEQFDASKCKKFAFVCPKKEEWENKLDDEHDTCGKKNAQKKESADKDEPKTKVYPCKLVKAKEGTDKGEETKIKMIFPCQHEEIKSEIRENVDDKESKCEEKETKTEDKKCEHKRSKPDDKKRDTKKEEFTCKYNERKREKKNETNIKAFPPCQNERKAECGKDNKASEKSCDGNKDEERKTQNKKLEELENKIKILFSSQSKGNKNKELEKNSGKKDASSKSKPRKKKFPCKFVPMKTGKSKNKKEETKIKVFVPCKYEQITSGLRKPECTDDVKSTEETENDSQNQNEDCDDKKTIVPCPNDETKSEIRTQCEEKEQSGGKMETTEKEFTCKYVPRKRTEEGGVKNEQKKIKVIVPCKYEETKSGLRKGEYTDSIKRPEEDSCECDGNEDRSKTSSEKQTEDCHDKKLIFPCQDEEIMGEKYAESREKEESGKKEFTCKYKARKKDDKGRDKKEETKIKVLVPCKNQKQSEEDCEDECNKREDQSKTKKLIFPCQDEKIKTEICAESKEKEQSGKKETTIKEFTCKYKARKKGEQGRDKKEETKIKVFVPCKYEKIKPGIRKPEWTEENECTKQVEKECERRQDQSKTYSEKQNEDCVTKKLIFPCQNEEIKTKICAGSKEREQKESAKKEFTCKYKPRKKTEKGRDSKTKVVVPCQHETIKAGIRQPEDKTDFKSDKEEETPYKCEKTESNNCAKFEFVCPQDEDKDHQKPKNHITPCEEIPKAKDDEE